MTFRITFHATVSKIEERFQTMVTDPISYGEARWEGKAVDCTEKVSIGWWLVIADWPVAISVGMQKPELKAGDILSICFAGLDPEPVERDFHSPYLGEGGTR